MQVKTKIKSILKPIWNSRPLFSIRGFIFNTYEAVTDYSIEKKKFRRALGYELDLKNPRSLNQKIVWKKIYDRNPLLVRTSDKYLVRDYVQETMNDSSILIPLYSAVDDPKLIPFDNLPEEYIIKTNHDSGGYVIVRKGDRVGKEKIIKKLGYLMSLPYGLFKHEWAYQKINRKIIVEKLLRNEQGDLAQDYKFHVFGGKCKFIHTTPKTDGGRTGVRSLFTPDWKLIDVGWKHPKGPEVPKPDSLDEMISIAEKLGSPFDYVRVDLYNVSGRVYFGELTHYHGSGMEKFNPQSFDFEIGNYWKAVPEYWKISNTDRS